MSIARMILAAGILTAAAIPSGAQEIKLPPDLEKLADKAEQSVDVTMNKSMLQMAARFLSDHDGDEAKTRKLIAGLDSVIVRSFEFARDGEYSAADVDAVRARSRRPRGRALSACDPSPAGKTPTSTSRTARTGNSAAWW